MISMETSNIEEAKIIPDEAEDLTARLKKATEFKTPGTNTTPKSTTQTKAGNAWTSSDDFEEEKPKPQAKPGTENPGEDITVKKITEKSKRASARMGVSMYDTFQRGIFTAAVNIKTKNKLNKLDPDKLELVADVNKATLTGEAFQLRDKLDKILESRDKKMNRIPLDQQEKQDMEEMIYNYCDATDSILSPVWGLVFAMAAPLGKRATDLFAD